MTFGRRLFIGLMVCLSLLGAYWFGSNLYAGLQEPGLCWGGDRCAEEVESRRN